jgi:anaerobic ribonucleoside-triphosphate reductase activating protein
LKLKLAGFKAESIVDGPGIRATVFFQGCPHHCPGCHNPETHDPESGFTVTVNEVATYIKGCSGISGVTFSGGEPFGQVAAAAELAAVVKKEGLNLLIYSGYTFDQLIKQSTKDRNCERLLKAAWLLIDGPFMLERQNYDLPFRGSDNQRIIDLKQSARQQKVVQWEPS